MNILQTSRRYCYVWYLLLLLSLCSCRKNDPKPNYPAGTNENINTWILDSLKRYYYWNESLPSRPDIGTAPKDFFMSLRNPADRFSYLILPNDPSSYIPSSKGKYGFDYSTIKESSTGQVIGIVKLVLDDSPASRNGLKRGDYIRTINGKRLDENNAATLQAELLSGNQVSLGLAELSGSSWSESRLVDLNTGVILDQREISRIIEIDSKKIGYISFHTFNPGLASSLKSVFTDFKSSGIADLVLDLRYNSGGQVAEAAGLCTMIAAGVSYNSPFITYKGNKNGGIRTESLGTAATFDHTLDFNSLLQSNLGLHRIYILSTGSTASAAEVMINNLRPYMQVIVIGEKTIGKDEASFLISDLRSPKLIDWEMHPIIYKLFNAAGDGNYSSGIAPDILVNELASLPLLPFGETNDPLLKAALSNISGKVKAKASTFESLTSHALKANNSLTDTRVLGAQKSIVLTHR